MVAPRRAEIGAFISKVVERLGYRDARQPAGAAGRTDLQYIRINGTLVGGLVGLLIFWAKQFF